MYSQRDHKDPWLHARDGWGLRHRGVGLPGACSACPCPGLGGQVLLQPLLLFPTSQSLVQGGLPGSGVPSELPQLIPVFPGGTPLLPPVVGGSIPVSSPLPPASFGLVMDPSKKLAASVLDALDPPGSALDSLDLLPYSDTRLDALDSFGSTRGALDKPNSFVGKAWVGTFTPTPLTVFKVPPHLQSLGSGVGIPALFSQGPGPLSPLWSKATVSELPCLLQCSA